MTRKCDYSRRSFLVPACPWTDVQRTKDVSFDDFGIEKQELYTQQIKCEDLSAQTLNPKEVTLKKILDSGVTIPVSGLQHLLDATDISDIENAAVGMSDKITKYIEENKDSFRSELVKSGHIVEPSNDAAV